MSNFAGMESTCKQIDLTSVVLSIVSIDATAAAANVERRLPELFLSDDGRAVLAIRALWLSGFFR